MRLVLCIKDVGVTRRKVGNGGRLEFWVVVWWKEDVRRGDFAIECCNRMECLLMERSRRWRWGIEEVGWRRIVWLCRRR